MGCLGTASSQERVVAINATDGPLSVSVLITRAYDRVPQFDHTFMHVPPGEELAVDHSFRSGREYRINATAFGGNTSAREAAETVTIPSGGHVLVRVGPSAIDISVLVADRGDRRRVHSVPPCLRVGQPSHHHTTLRAKVRNAVCARISCAGREPCSCTTHGRSMTSSVRTSKKPALRSASCVRSTCETSGV